MRNILSLFIILMSLSLAGCFGDGDEPTPPSETGSTAIDEVILGDDFELNPDFRAIWDPAIGLLPYPNDILGFRNSTDGSLALAAVPTQPLVSQLNFVDGFSTSNQGNYTLRVELVNP